MLTSYTIFKTTLLTDVVCELFEAGIEADRKDSMDLLLLHHGTNGT